MTKRQLAEKYLQLWMYVSKIGCRITTNPNIVILLKAIEKDRSLYETSVNYFTANMPVEDMENDIKDIETAFHKATGMTLAYGEIA